MAFFPEEFSPYKKDFVGVIVRAEYDTEWSREHARFETRYPVLRVMIKSPEYAKPQYEWYGVTDKQKTKWFYFVQFLHDALMKSDEGRKEYAKLRELLQQTTDKDERARKMAEWLVGTEWRFIEREFEVMGQAKKTELIVPLEFKRRVPKEELETIKVETVTPQGEW